MTDPGHEDPWADGEDPPALAAVEDDDPWADDPEDDDPWADDEPELLEADPAAWDQLLANYAEAIGEANRREQDRGEGIDAMMEAVAQGRADREAAFQALREGAARYGLIAQRGAGPYREHLMVIESRVGDPKDSAGEHGWAKVMTGEHAGRRYRMHIIGGPGHLAALEGVDLINARRAPHVLGGGR